MIKNGDLPAVPVWCGNSDQQLYGLTKREMFAMTAMQGLLANESDRLPQYIAADGVIAADALLAELERTNGL